MNYVEASHSNSSSCNNFFPHRIKFLVDQGLIIEVSRLQIIATPHLVGLLWKGDQPDAQTST